MGEDPLTEVARTCFRAAALEHLSAQDEYQLFDSFQLPPIPTNDDFNEILDGLLQPSETSTFIKPITNDNGEILGFEEENRESDELGAATSSMSLSRIPFAGQTSVKGSSSNVPFYPGGLNDAFSSILSFESKKTDEATLNELELLETTDFLTRPPGFTKDVLLPTDIQEKKTESEVSQSRFSHIFEENSKLKDDSKKTYTDTTVSESKSDKSLDELPLLDGVFHLKSQSAVKPQSTFAYAKEICTTSNIPEYETIRPRMAKEYPFELDPFQQASVLCMENGESLFVAAHTSAGKTVVAEYAVALCKQHKTKAIYTSPIKALSNQKFRDFKAIFDDVGLVTGDIQLYPEAFCLIMTTEILRSMLYNGSEVIRDLEWVVFDEVHYINNAERGHVWEEVLIMLPEHVKIVMLSATVPNCVEFADWVGRIKNRRINVIFTLKRPVPLEHYLYTGQDGKTKKDMFKIVDEHGQWVQFGYRKAQEAKALLKKNELMKPKPGQAQGQKKGPNNGTGPGGKGKPEEKKPQQGGGGGNMSVKPIHRNDKNVYISLVDHLRSIDKLPVVIFVFSRKRCDDNAQLLSSIDLTSNMEKSEINKFFSECTGRLKGSDKRLPQVLQMRDLCLRGFAVHHSGILPILKEVVELLFQQGLVKILFATETFAMGVNMPARTVVFDAITKHDGNSLRLLNTGEYIQMAGRAGRRGLDTTGTVIVLAKGLNLPEEGELQCVTRGAAIPLESQFRVTYSMLLNLLRVEQLKIEDMLQRSYVESASLRDGLTRKAKLNESVSKLDVHTSLVCDVCEPTSTSKPRLRDFHDALIGFLTRRSLLWARLAAEAKEVDKLFTPGRVLILSNPTHRLENRIGLLLKQFITDAKKEFEVMVPCTAEEALPETVRREIEEWRTLSDQEKIWLEETNWLEGAIKYGLEEVQPPESFDYFRVIRVPLSSLIAIGDRNIKMDAAAIVNEARNREIPRFRNNPIDFQTQKVITELNFLAESWQSGAQVKIPGIDISISNACLIEDVAKLISLRDRLLIDDEFPAKHCENFVEHTQLLRSRIKLEREVEKLRYQLSSDALLLSEDYQNKLKVLKALGYVTDGDMVSFKGRVACEIHHQELLITELILENKLHTRSTAEVAAMLSATTCQYRAQQEAKFEPGSIFAELKRDVEDVRWRLETVGQEMRVSIVDVGDDIRFDLMEIVYNWASGMPFSEIMSKTGAQEGLIVRCVQRLAEVCKDVRNAARIVGDPALHEKMEQVSAAIKRDIVFAASLYTTV